MSISEELVNFVRGYTRPFCTGFSLISCIYLQVEFGVVPDWLLVFTGGMLTFWFGEKAISRLNLTRGKDA